MDHNEELAVTRSRRKLLMDLASKIANSLIDTTKEKREINFVMETVHAILVLEYPEPNPHEDHEGMNFEETNEE